MTKATRPSKSAAVDESADSLDRLLCGRVRELRKKRSWTLEQLSAASGVSKSMLSQIERGEANPTLAVAYRIAQAFSLTIGELVETPETAPRVEVIRGVDRAFHYRSDKNCQIRTLSPLHLEKSVEFYEIVLRENGILSIAPHFKGARELLTVQSGHVRAASGQAASDLAPGDSAHYPADVQHSIKNTGKGEAVLFLVVTYVIE